MNLEPYDELFRLGGWHGRRGRSLPGASEKSRVSSGGNRTSRKTIDAASCKAALRRTVTRTPEVMVKISGGAKNSGGMRAHLSYIARTDAHAERKGKEPVVFEDQNGTRYRGSEDVSEIAELWSNGRNRIPRGGSTKQTFNIILSMPPGTSRSGVEAAARKFAGERFSEHDYVFASHDDEAHPHIHICVKAVDRNGRRLNPRKNDLQQWRQEFAKRLRDEGIAANATPRKTRGVAQKAIQQRVLHMDSEYKAGRRNRPSEATIAHRRIVQGDQKEALYEEKDKNGFRRRVAQNPLASRIEHNFITTVRAYADIARELAHSNDPSDRQLARLTLDFAKQLAPPQTRIEKRMRINQQIPETTISKPVQDQALPRSLSRRIEDREKE